MARRIDPFAALAVVLLAATVGCAGGRAVVRPLDAPRTGTWGDQGDGTFRNPILSSNYPDSDIERDGDRWYMISSKGLYMKGMTILESEDLVNWQVIGGIVDSVTWPTREGVWAGDLVRRDGRWLCYFIDYDCGLFMCESGDIRGPWSEPKLMLEKKGMTDPAVFWDDAGGQAWLLCNHRIEERGAKRIYHQRLFRLSADGRTLADDGRDIYVEQGAEAAKIYKVNGLFYIFISEWTTDEAGRKLDRRQIVLRSKNIDGPYERKVLLEKGNGTDRSCCQGSLVQAPDSSWWYTHQLVQARNTFEGRPQLLIPVTWSDGWPLLGEDVTGNGIGNTVWHCRKPVQGKPIAAPRTDDDFSSGELLPHWLWDGNPVAGQWSLTQRPGWLRLGATVPINAGDPYFSAPGKLLQRKMGTGADTVTTRMDTRGMAPGHRAGLVHKGFNLAAVGVHHKDGKRFLYTVCDGRETQGPHLKGRYVWLRSCVQGREGHFEYSTDGRDYLPLESGFTTETRGFNGVFTGFFSINPSGGGHADFDWFKYDYDGPKAEALVFE